MTPEPGLHKKVSSIFDGVQIPGRENSPTEMTSPPEVPAPVAPLVDLPSAPQASATGSDTPPQAPTSAPETPAATSSGTNAPTPQPDQTFTPTTNEQTAPAPGMGGAPELTQGAPAPTQRPASQPTRSTGAGRQVRKKTQTSTPLRWVRRWLTAGMDDPEVARQKKMKALVAVLAVALGTVLFFSLREPKSGKAESADAAVAQGTTPAEITWERPELLPADLRDPMVLGDVSKPPTGTEATAQAVDTSRFVVTGIVQGNKGYLALVSGKIVSEGDVVFDARVINIQPDGVEFESNGQRWVQPLRK